MLGTMDKKKSSKSAPKERTVLSMRIDLDTEAAIASFIESQRVRPDKTAVVMLAIHEFLEKEGFWPPPKK